MTAVAGRRALERELPGEAGPLNYAELAGEDPALLLLHGLSTRWQVFRPLLTALRGRAHAYALDFRGHGRSAWTPGRYDLAGFRADAAALLDRIGRPAVVYGHSLGGVVALSLAAERPERVLGAVVADSVLFPARHPTSLKEAPLAFRSLATAFHQMDPEALAHFRAGRLGETYSPEALLPRVSCPTLLLQADAQRGGLMTDDDVSRALRMLPDATHARCPGIGHGMHTDDPETVLASVLPFITAVTASHREDE